MPQLAPIQPTHPARYLVHVHRRGWCPIETWRLLPSNADYEVSDHGRVRCLRRWKKRQFVAESYYPKQHRTRTGHVCVSLGRSRRGRRVEYVHRMVLEAFVGPCPAGMECCHNNGDPADNRLTNLRWDTRQANVMDMYRAGAPKGRRVLLTAEHVRQIRAHDGWLSRRHLAEIFGVSKATLANVLSRKTWRHVS